MSFNLIDDYRSDNNRLVSRFTSTGVFSNLHLHDWVMNSIITRVDVYI